MNRPALAFANKTFSVNFLALGFDASVIFFVRELGHVVPTTLNSVLPRVLQWHPHGHQPYHRPNHQLLRIVLGSVVFSPLFRSLLQLRAFVTAIDFAYATTCVAPIMSLHAQQQQQRR